MPIEKINTESNLPSLTNQPNLINNNSIVAGTLLVKHPLIEERLQLIGFVVEDKYFNPDDFKIMGMKISYGDDNLDYFALNDTIYPRLSLDAKKNHCSYYFKDSPLRWREAEGHDIAYLVGDKYRRTKNEGSPEAYCKTQYNYYLFESSLSELPECAADNVLALCKYKANDTFKYFLSNLHELLPLIS